MLSVNAASVGVASGGAGAGGGGSTMTSGAAAAAAGVVKNGAAAAGGSGVVPATVDRGPAAGTLPLSFTRNEAMSDAGGRRGCAARAGSSPVMRRRSWRSVSFEISFSVSNTPSPRDATASTQSYFRSPSNVETIVSGSAMFGRSRLLSCSTSGMSSMSRPISARFSLRLWKLSTFASSMAACESATKTTPSTPLSTSFRVVL